MTHDVDDEVLTWGELTKGFSKLLSWSFFRMVCFGVCLGNVAWFIFGMLHHGFTADLPWILQAGHTILDQQAIPTHDVFSWTHASEPWVLYQWLFEVLVAYGQRVMGLELMMKLFILLVIGVAVLAPFYGVISKRIPTLLILLPTTTALYVTSVNMALRPLLITAVFLMLQYVCIRWVRRQQISKLLLFIVMGVMYALWGNMHMGVTIGLFSLLLMALGDVAELKQWYRFEPHDPDIEGQPLSFKMYGALIGLGILASFLNPYGVGIYAYLFDLSSQSYLNDVIVELSSPNFHMMQYWFFLALFSVFVLLMTQKAQRLFSAQELLLLLVFSFLMFIVQRFVVWTCLLYAYILPKALYQWWFHKVDTGSTVWEDLIKGFEVYRPFFVVMLGVFVFLFLFLPTSLRPEAFPTLRLGHCQDLMAGIEAYQTLKKPQDKLFNDPEIGSCMLFRYPDQKVFVDTRFDFYGAEFTKRGRQTLLLFGDWQGFLKEWEINTIVMLKKRPLTEALKTLGEYTAVYEDDHVVILKTAAQQ